MIKPIPVIADPWQFIDYKSPDYPAHLPLFISRVLAVTKNGRQFITWFNHETDSWVLYGEEPLAEGDYIMAWTQIHGLTEEQIAQGKMNNAIHRMKTNVWKHYIKGIDEPKEEK